jgi:hypothetical protein
MQTLGQFTLLTGQVSCAVLYMQPLHRNLCCPLQPAYDENIMTALRRNRHSLVRRGITTQIIVNIQGINDKINNVPSSQKGTRRYGSTYSGPLRPTTRLPPLSNFPHYCSPQTVVRSWHMRTQRSRNEFVRR